VARHVPRHFRPKCENLAGSGYKMVGAPYMISP